MHIIDGNINYCLLDCNNGPGRDALQGRNHYIERKIGW